MPKSKKKIYISVDMEGVTGVVNWKETEFGDDYQYYRNLMTKEANAAIDGALEAGASEVIIRDAHNTARNIIPDMLNKKAKLIRAWSGAPYSMMEGIDNSFDAAVMIGYHAKAMTINATLDHTMDGSVLDLRVNDVSLPEAGWNGLIAGYYSVPVIFLSGDKAVCDQAKSIFGKIDTIAVKEGIGEASINLHPELSQELIKKGVKASVKKLNTFKPLRMKPPYTIQIYFKHEEKASRLSYYPNAKRVGTYGVQLSSNDFFDIMRFFNFR